MQVTCPSCRAPREVADDDIPAGGKVVQCKSCGGLIQVSAAGKVAPKARRPERGQRPEPAESPVAPAPASALRTPVAPAPAPAPPLVVAPAAPETVPKSSAPIAAPISTPAKSEAPTAGATVMAMPTFAPGAPDAEPEEVTFDLDEDTPPAKVAAPVEVLPPDSVAAELDLPQVSSLDLAPDVASEQSRVGPGESPTPAKHGQWGESAEFTSAQSSELGEAPPPAKHGQWGESAELASAERGESPLFTNDAFAFDAPAPAAATDAALALGDESAEFTSAQSSDLGEAPPPAKHGQWGESPLFTDDPFDLDLTPPAMEPKGNEVSLSGVFDAEPAPSISGAFDAAEPAPGPATVPDELGADLDFGGNLELESGTFPTHSEPTSEPDLEPDESSESIEPEPEADVEPEPATFTATLGDLSAFADILAPTSSAAADDAVRADEAPVSDRGESADRGESPLSEAAAIIPVDDDVSARVDNLLDRYRALEKPLRIAIPAALVATFLATLGGVVALVIWLWPKDHVVYVEPQAVSDLGPQSCQQVHVRAELLDAASPNELGELCAWLSDYRADLTFESVETWLWGVSVLSSLDMPADGLDELNQAASACVTPLRWAAWAQAHLNDADRLQLSGLSWPGVTRLSHDHRVWLVAARLRDPAALRGDLERWLDLHPTHAALKLQRLDWLLESDLPEAQRFARALVDEHPYPQVIDRVAALLLAASEHRGNPMSLRDTLNDVLDPVRLKLDDTVPRAMRMRLLLLMLRSRLQAGDLESATKAAQQVHELSPGDAKSLVLLGRLMLSYGKDPTRVHEAGRTSADNEWALGQIFLQMVEQKLTAGVLKPDALEALRPPFSSPAMDGAVELVRGDILRKSEGSKEALAAYQRALALDPTLVRARWESGLLLSLSPTVRIERLRALGGPESDYRVAQVLLEQGMSTQARSLPLPLPLPLPLLDSVFWNGPEVVDSVELLRAYALALAAEGDQERALHIMSTLQQQIPTDNRPLSTLVELSLRAKKLSDVVRWYTLIVANEPQSIDYRIALAQSYNAVQRYFEAEQLLLKIANERGPDGAASMLSERQRAWLLRQQAICLAERNPKEAREALLESLHQELDESAVLLLGALYERGGKPEDAVSLFRSTLGKRPEYSAVRLQLGRALVRQGSLARAEEIYRSLVLAQPERAELQVEYARLLLELGRAQKAVERFEAALPHVPHMDDRASVLMEIAEVKVHKLGRADGAVKTLQQVLGIFPDHVQAHYLLGYVYKDSGRLMLARTHLARYLALAPEGEFTSDVRLDLRDIDRRLAGEAAP